MRIFRWSFVRNSTLAARQNHIVEMRDRAHTAEGELGLSKLREAVLQAEAVHLKKRADDAQQQTAAAFASALSAIVDVRKTLAEAASISRLAATALFSVPDGDVPPAMGVREADKRAAQREREQAEGNRR